MVDLFRAPVCLIKTLQVLTPYKGKEAKYHVRKTMIEGITISLFNLQEVFLRNSLHIISYYSNLTQEILQMVVFKMLKVDVRMLLTANISTISLNR